MMMMLLGFAKSASPGLAVAIGLGALAYFTGSLKTGLVAAAVAAGSIYVGSLYAEIAGLHSDVISAHADTATALLKLRDATALVESKQRVIDAQSASIAALNDAAIAGDRRRAEALAKVDAMQKQAAGKIAQLQSWKPTAGEDDCHAIHDILSTGR